MQKTKKCKPRSKEGCGLVLPIEAFQHIEHRGEEGHIRVTVVNWCHECQKRRARIREAILTRKRKIRDKKANREKLLAAQAEGRIAKGEPPLHTGPLDCPSILFFCVIPPTQDQLPPKYPQIRPYY